MTKRDSSGKSKKKKNTSPTPGGKPADGAKRKVTRSHATNRAGPAKRKVTSPKVAHRGAFAGRKVAGKGSAKSKGTVNSTSGQNEGYKDALRKIEKARRTRTEMLDLSRLGLAAIPPEIWQLTAITQLDLSDNDLSFLPAEIGQLTALTRLYVSDNQLSFLPAEIGQLTSLTELDVSENQLSSLPAEIGQLTALTQLEVPGNQLSSLPAEIGQLTALTELNLSGNQLSSLPAEIGELTALTVLYVSGNQLSSLPAEIGQLTALTELNLSVNRLSSLPAEIGELTALSVLYVSGNQLSSLPAEIGRLTELTALHAFRNLLSSLPKEIAGLGQLVALDLEHNQFSQLPAEIGKITSLKLLDISENKLQSLPKEIGNLTNLERLFLHDNDGLGLPAEVLGPTYLETHGVRSKVAARPTDILAYYFRVREAKRPLNEAKLILVGRGGVGKTSLVNRLLRDEFNRHEGKTDGICISEWEVPLGVMERARLNIWDFGGQEIMHATHQFFLTQRSLYLLVLEGRQGAEDADAEYWLKLIESFGTDRDGEASPVIVVLNKIELNPFDLNRSALRQKYPFIRGFVRTDCSDEQTLGIDYLKSTITQETGQLKHLRADFPASWFAIKDKLAAMRKTTGRSFLSFDEYLEICRELGETKTAGQESLATHLHNLGIALNFKDDPRLKDTHILNPHWVTNGIYRILNSRLLDENKGEIRLADSGKILDLPEYPPNMHPFLFDLMRKFQLCFAFPDDDGHYLIPELLDKQQPAEAEAFLPEECLNFEYRYPILPEGLLPRFIVRTHSLSASLARWRSGAILVFEGNRALVKADVQDKRVTIAVDGPMAGRRRLLAVIRSDFERIHNEISKLRPEAFVPLPERPKAAVAYEKLLVLEKDGIETFVEVFDGKSVKLDVRQLLDGIDLEGTRRREIPEEGRRDEGISLFYSYSHKDEKLRDELETHLKLMERQRTIVGWQDRRIAAGEEWKDEIDRNLERAEIILLLVSADFIASNYCYDIEMKRAMERHEAGEATVIPIVLRNVDWTKARFGKLQALPKDGTAVTLWEDRDSAWRNVSEGIKSVAEKMKARKRGWLLPARSSKDDKKKW